MSSDTLHLVLPDWCALDTVFRSSLPFGLWTIGDQCLLHHWLDHAVNLGIARVVVHTADRPNAVRRVLKESSLWPIQTELEMIHPGTQLPTDAIEASWLPDSPCPPPPQDGWGLLERAATMERLWLERLQAQPDYHLTSIGFSCRIHPEAVLTPPYSIGDQVFIGPGCEIGPHAVIGRGSVVSGANRIVDSHLSAHSFVGPVTALEHCRLENGVLFNLKHQARLDQLETHLLSSLVDNEPDISLRDRMRALWLYLTLPGPRRHAAKFTTFDGRELPGSPSGGLWNRRAWLPMVWRGQLPLFGVLPRTQAQFDRLPPDWQNTLRHAPIGVFSYADTLGCHTPDDPEEPTHAVYQAALPPETLLQAMVSFTKTLRATLSTHAQPQP